jgi:hypothetical protein
MEKNYIKKNYGPYESTKNFYKKNSIKILQKLKEKRIQENLNRLSFMSKCKFCNNDFEQSGYNENGFKQRTHSFCSKSCEKRNQRRSKLIPKFLYKFYLNKKLYKFKVAFKNAKTFNIFKIRSRILFGNRNRCLADYLVYKNNNKNFLRKKLNFIIEPFKKIKRKKRYLNPEMRRRHIQQVIAWQNKQPKNSHYYISNALRKNVISALRSKGLRKKEKTIELLGADINTVWNHLESKFKLGMTKDNHGKWHIDHIKPCASFDLTKKEEQLKCFHYTNLQPLWARENLIKSDKIL